MVLLFLFSIALFTGTTYADPEEPSSQETMASEESGSMAESTSSSESESTEESTAPAETEPEEPAGPVTVPFIPFSEKNYPAGQAMTLAVLEGASTLNLRDGPGKEYEVLAYIDQGILLRVEKSVVGSDRQTWYYVHTAYETENGELCGYLSGKYLRLRKVEQNEDPYEQYLLLLGFTEPYLPYLKKLHAQYPSWGFKAAVTDLDWKDVVYNEANPPVYPGISLIHDYSISSWKSTKNGFYNWTTSSYTPFDGTKWVCASDELVAYYLDPRNFMDDQSVFMFLEDLKFSDYHTLAGVEAIAAGTFMAEPAVDVDGTPFYYPEVIYNIGKKLGISPYYLASTIKQEIGVAGTSKSISGNSENFPGYFNYYNIYASTTDRFDANDQGLWFASGQEVGATSYGRPWDTRLRALQGGAEYLTRNYIVQAQSTIYYKRFNVIDPSRPLYRHQYMTNVQGAYAEGRLLAAGYDSEARSHALVFNIPVYTNMPASPDPCPTGDGSPNNRLKNIVVGDYELFPEYDMNTLVYSVTISDGSSAVEITAEAYDSKAKVEGTGEKPIRIGANEFDIKVTAENGDVRTYSLVIYREPTENDPPTYDPLYPISEEGYISGLNPGTAQEDFITALGLGSYTKAQLWDGAKSDPARSLLMPKAEGDVMKTGDIVYVFTEQNPEEQILLGTVVIYGDVNGDGAIKMLDLIRVRNHILETSILTDAYAEAADVSRDGVVKMLDLIRIRNSILGTSIIDQ